MHGRRATAELLIERGANLADRAWGGRGPTPLDCALWGIRNNPAHDGDYVGTVEALAAAGAPTFHRPPSADPAVDRVLERHGVLVTAASVPVRVTLSAQMQVAAAKPTPSGICPAAGGDRAAGFGFCRIPLGEQAMSSDVIYTMYRADKFYGPERQVLSNISLSFLHGAKIGVLGPNGAGKSTLLRIMAGLEEPSSGVAELDPKATVGFLPQEPELDPAKDVRGERRGRRPRAARPARPLQRDLGGLRRARRGLRRAARGAGGGAGADRPRGRVEPRPDARPRDGRAPPPGGRPRRDDALRRRAPPRGALPAAALGARPAPPRRADEPPRRRVGRVARAVPRGVQGHRHRGHARSVLPRQRRRLDPRARPRQGHPVPGELLVVARAEGGAARRSRRSRTPPAAARCSASSSGCA